jgi:hypothetical protein
LLIEATARPEAAVVSVVITEASVVSERLLPLCRRKQGLKSGGERDGWGDEGEDTMKEREGGHLGSESPRRPLPLHSSFLF